MALVMALVDSAIVDVALPSIARSLDIPPAQAIWVLNVDPLAIVVSLFPLSVLGQVVPFRKVFLRGIALFVLASISSTQSGAARLSAEGSGWCDRRNAGSCSAGRPDIWGYVGGDAFCDDG